MIEKATLDRIPVPDFRMFDHGRRDEIEAPYEGLRAGATSWDAVDEWVAHLYGLGPRDLQVISDTLAFNLPFAQSKRDAHARSAGEESSMLHYTTQGPTVPPTFSRLLGSNLRPLIVHVAGTDRSYLEGVPGLHGHCAYIGVFGADDPMQISCYMGMTSCGQDRPRYGAHLAYPSPATSVFVITDAGGALTGRDAAVLERFFFAKISEVTEWSLRCRRPHAPGVGMKRFSELMEFGGEVLRLLQEEHSLFTDIAPERRCQRRPSSHRPAPV